MVQVGFELVIFNKNVFGHECPATMMQESLERYQWETEELILIGKPHVDRQN